MFINLTARKPNGDFYITSSEVIAESFPHLTALEIRELIEERARVLAANGWEVDLAEDLEDLMAYAEAAADADAIYYGA